MEHQQHLLQNRERESTIEAICQFKTLFCWLFNLYVPGYRNVHPSKQSLQSTNNLTVEQKANFGLWIIICVFCVHLGLHKRPPEGTMKCLGNNYLCTSSCGFIWECICSDVLFCCCEWNQSFFVLLKLVLNLIFRQRD